MVCRVGWSRHQPSRRQYAQELLQVASNHQSRNGRPSQPSRRGHSSYKVDDHHFYPLLLFFFFFCNSSHVSVAYRYSSLMSPLPLFKTHTACVYLRATTTSTTLHFIFKNIFGGFLSTLGRYNICTRVNEPCSTLGIYSLYSSRFRNEFFF